MDGRLPQLLELVSLRRPDTEGTTLVMKPESSRFTTQIRLETLADTAALGAQLAGGLQSGDALALTGDLGAGKTELARMILRALGVTGPIASPTFTLVQTYDTARLAVAHYDLYRIEDPRELDELGLDEALAEGAALIEWPERAAGLLPADTLNLRLTLIDTHSDAQTRLVEIDAPARWAAHLSPKG